MVGQSEWKEASALSHKLLKIFFGFVVEKVGRA